MGQHRRLLARNSHQAALRFALLFFGVVLVMPGPAIASPPDQAVSAEFTVPASNGYSLSVRSEGGQLRLIAFREAPALATASAPSQLEGEGSYASATYYAPATGGPEAIAADFGALGKVDVAFQPSGQTRVVHLSQRRKSRDCTFPRRIVRRLGTFAGTISFHGENGYTSLEVSSAPGSVGTSPFRNCSTERPARREGVFGQAGPDVFLDAANPPSHVFFGASTLGPGAGFYASVVEPQPSGYAIVRTVEAHASGALTLHAARHVATFRPPAPFSGAATYRRDAAHPWSGSLAVIFPGVTVPLTGAAFKAQMRLSE